VLNIERIAHGFKLKTLGEHACHEVLISSDLKVKGPYKFSSNGELLDC
jgi:hypothetical protein